MSSRTGDVTPRVSVVIVNFNSGAALASALDSLPGGLEGLDWEAVVVDNASSDGSERAVSSASRTRLLRNPVNLGFGAAVNAGVGDTSAPFALVLNPDCVLGPGSGRMLLQILEEHPACAVAGPRILDPSGALQDSARGDPNLLTGLFGRSSSGSRWFPQLRVVDRNLVARRLADSREASHVVDWVSGACMLVRREAFAAVGGFDTGYFLYWEDADLCRRLRGAGWEIRYATRPTAVHAAGSSSRTVKALANREFHRSAYRYFTKFVVPNRWHPGRPLGWAMLMLRARMKALLNSDR